MKALTFVRVSQVTFTLEKKNLLGPIDTATVWAFALNVTVKDPVGVLDANIQLLEVVAAAMHAVGGKENAQWN